jgi:anti-sigma factor RsiW
VKAESVHLFVDDELAPQAREEMAAHMASCPECTARLAEGLALKRAVRHAARRDSAPADLHAAVRRQIAGSSTSTSSWQWLAAAAALLLTVAAGAAFWTRKGSDDPLLAELVDQHVVALSSANPVDVVSEDRHTVKPWFQGRLPFTFALPELAGTNYQLLGGKVTYLRQRPAAELLYQAGRHKISVFIVDDSGLGGVPGTSSFHVQHWTSSGLAFYIVTDASDAEAMPLVTLLKNAK